MGHLGRDPMALLEMSREPEKPARPPVPPRLIPPNSERPFDPNFERPLRGPDIDDLNALLPLLQSGPQNTKEPHTGGGDGEPAGYVKRTALEKKLNECTKKLFGVELWSFTRSRDGHNGSFTGYGADALSSGGRDTQITVVNEVNSYTGSQLGTLHGTPNAVLMGLTFNTVSSTHTPYRNFTASGLTNSKAIIATQIHELGNSLRAITKVTMGPNSPAGIGGDTDAGTRLERCVFGGEID